MINPGDIRQGFKIADIPAGQPLGPKRARQIVAAMNAFLSLRVVRGGADRLIVAGNNSILQLKRDE